ncbi:UPF0728 protein-like [Patiria miniata]|uniref:Uncharacterized protein n=1 Tax=Patiria miniata TaxID=46514 RepID=A0A914AE35_PATMI|nr:UPF0728 protein-like [Patiria miniata]
MPKSALVTVRYGPYRACGIVEHRTSRLEGLQALLSGDGHTVELCPIDDWNKVELIVNGETVYRCDITQMDYGSDGQLDKLCHDALEAVRKAF